MGCHGLSKLFSVLSSLLIGLVASAWPGAAAAEPGNQRTLLLSLYPDAALSPQQFVFSAQAGPLDFRFLDAQPISADRCLLLIVLPIPSADITAERLILRLADEIGTLSLKAPLKVRAGFPILDGIITDPLPGGAAFRKALLELARRYVFISAREPSPERTIDLIGSLMIRAQEAEGAVDCLLAGADRPIAGNDSALLASGAERYLTMISARAGSTLYGLLRGKGVLRNICLVAGGIVFDDEEPISSVAGALLAMRERGYIARFEIAGDRMLKGGFPLSIRPVGPGSEAGIVRAPRMVWYAHDNAAIPDCLSMQTAMDLKRQARDADGIRNLQKAIQLLTAASEKDPWNPDCLASAAKTAVEMGNLREAEHLLAMAATFVPPPADAVLLYAGILQRQDRADQALRVIKEARAAGLTEMPALLLVEARLLARLNRLTEARAAFEKTLQAEAKMPEARAEYAQVLWLLGDVDGAGTQAQWVLAREPENLTALICASQAAAFRGGHEEAAGFARRAMEAHPNNADAYSQMARLDMIGGRFEAAVRHVRAALAFSPDHRDLLKLLAETWVRARDFHSAGETLRRLLEIDPTDIDSYRLLARTLEWSGAISDAAEVLEHGATRAGEDAHKFFREAAALRERRSEFGQAALDYRAMLRSFPSPPAPSFSTDVAQHVSYLLDLIAGDRSAEATGMPAPGNMEGAIHEVNQPRQSFRCGESQTDSDTVRVPGGGSLLARTLGLDPSLMKEPDALERVFSYILEASPSRVVGPAGNPLQKAVLLNLKHYEALIRHLKKQKILSPELDESSKRDLVFPLAGNANTVQRTRDFLRFFGGSLDISGLPADPAKVVITLKQDPTSRERQELLRHLGVDLQKPQLSGFEITLGDDHLPLLIDPRTAALKLLGKTEEKPERLLEGFLRDPKAMRLYNALAACSASSRAALIRLLDAAELRDSAELLASYGIFLTFTDDDLLLPGLRQSWGTLLAAAPGDRRSLVRALFGRENGRALRLYAALSQASAPVQEYCTAAAERLEQLYFITPRSDSLVSGYSLGEMWRLDLARLLRLVKVDDFGPYFPLDSRFAPYLFRSAPSPNGGDPSLERERTRFDLSSLRSLLECRPGSGCLPPWSVAEMLEFLIYLQAERKELIDGENIAAIMENPADVPVFLDLVWDLRPSAKIATEYLQYCRSLVRTTDSDWLANRTRTSQAVFFLVNALRRQGAMEQAKGRELLEDALAAMSSQDEASFALRIAAFLSDRLMPAIDARRGDAGVDDLLAAALTGGRSRIALGLDGKALEYDARERARRRFDQTIRHQSFISLSNLLALYQALASARAGADRGPTGFWNDLAKAVANLRTRQFLPEASEDMRRRASYSDLGRLAARIDAQVQRAAEGSEDKRLLSDIAAGLHAELGIALLAYCYGVSGSPEVDMLAFDPVLVRKHDFREKSPKGGWSRAYLKNDPSGRSALAGSLAGLSHQLSRLEMAQAVQTFGRRDGTELIPAIVSGVRAVAPGLRSDRAQEYVALAAQVGREVVAHSSMDQRIAEWLQSYLERNIMPPRRERLLGRLRMHDTGTPMRELTPSEIYLIGQSYVAGILESGNAAGRVDLEERAARGADRVSDAGDGMDFSHPKTDQRLPRFFAPAVDRIAHILAGASASDAEQFRQEMNQYGILMSARVGLTQFSLPPADSYEFLEASAHPDLLYERICDLKIRLAEINYALGLPAALMEDQIRLAVRDVVPDAAAVQTTRWQLAIDRIRRLDAGAGRAWTEEMINEGILVIVARGTGLER